MSRFWREMRVNCVTRGGKRANSDLDKKIARVNQPAVAI